MSILSLQYLASIVNNAKSGISGGSSFFHHYLVV